ncbi:hypothetical protein C0995_009600, partial [Termitomyces sp. Mi166
MAPKISLLNVSPDACLLECEHAAQKFIVAANAVFLKAQGLAMLAPLHEMAFGLLEGLLDDWCLLNLTTIEWLCKAEVHQACVNIWSLNKQVPWAAEFRKMVVSWEHAISTIEQIKLMHFEKMAIELKSSMPTVAPQPIVNPAPTPVSTTSLIQRAPSVPYIANPSSPPMHLLSELSLQEQEEFWHLFVTTGTFFLMVGKGKAKATEDDDDDEEAAQKLRKELKDFVVPTTFDDKLLASLLPPPSEYFEGDSGLPQGTKILGGQKGDITLVSPAMSACPTTWLITAGTRLASILAGAVIASQKAACGMVAKAFLEWQGKPSQFFILEGYKGKGKAKALLEDSEPTGAKQSFKSRELVDSDSDKKEEEDRVRMIKKIMLPSMSKFVPKLIVMLAFPVAGPLTAPIASSSALKPAAATALSKPTPATSAGPAVKEGSIFKDSFMVRHFKLVGTEESGALIINQATEVPATQGTLHSEESGDEDAEGDDDDSDGGDVAMNIDSAKQPEETRPVAPIKTVTEVKAPALVLAPAL